MSVFKRIGGAIRNAWLAGLGAVSVGKKTTTKSIEKVNQNAKQHINELIVEGASLEKELHEKLQLRDGLDRRISAINNALGRTRDVNDSQLLLLGDKVDQLTIVVNQLIAKKMAEKKVVRKPRKAAVKKTATKTATKTAKINVEPTAAQMSS